MPHGHKRIGRILHSWWWLLAPLALLSGCANLIEQVSSKDFKFNDLFAKEVPPVKKLESDDGAKRAEGLRLLPEPKQNGGTDQEQEFYIKVLTTAATSPNEHYYCRLNAIKTLGRTKDPRAADVLKTVYLQDLTKYSPELINIMRQQTLTALAETKQDVARNLLIIVAKEPPSSGDYKEQQETVDRRLAAIRGLANFNHPDALATLAYVLKTDQDVAVGHRAHESLELATGKSLPMDPVELDRVLYAGRAPTPPAANATIQPAPQVQQVSGAAPH